MRNRSHESDVPTSGPGAGDRCLELLILLWPIMLIVSAGVVGSTDASAPPEPIRTSINPNIAPWWELTVLPRIGEGTARRIVRYRESATREAGTDRAQPAFQRASDLTRVRGIGARTLQRIARDLRFDDG